MVWCAMHKTKIIGPHFFRQTLVDAAAYKSMPRYFTMYHIEKLPGSPIFQQDGAPSHTDNTVNECLDRKLGYRWISRQGPINRRARSPDLTPLDFFFWGYVRDQVYSERIQSVEHLQSQITKAVRSVDTDTPSNV